MQTYTPAEARRELKELGFVNISVRPNGATTWVLANRTVFVPAKSGVPESIIRDARRHALTLSIADVPAQEPIPPRGAKELGPPVGSAAWMGLNGPESLKFCDHAPNEKTDVSEVDVVDGKVAKCSIYHYFCREHQRYGVYTTKEVKKTDSRKSGSGPTADENKE